MDEAVDEAETQARLARERLAVLDAVMSAQRRHGEVTATLWAAEDRRTAIAAVVELLGVQPWVALAVVDLPWWRLGAGSRRQVEEDRDETARQVARLDDPGDHHD